SLGAREQKRGHLDGGAFRLPEKAGRGEVELIEGAGDLVVAVEVVTRESHPQRVIDGSDPGLAFARHLDAPRGTEVASDLVCRHLDAPGGEQLLQVRTGVRARLGGIGSGGIRLRMRIDEGDQPPAPKHELVDGEQRLVREVLRVDEEKNVDVFGDLAAARANRLDLEELLELRVSDTGIVRRTRLAAIGGARQRQRRDQTYLALCRACEVMDDANDAVLEEPFPRLVEEGDRLGIVGTVGAG